MFTSPTYGPVSMERMIELLREFYDRNKGYDCPFNVTVGTDSQNFDTTKIVTCVVMQCEHHGGIYFYKIENVERIQNVSAKLNYETHLSLEYANQLLEKMMELDEDMFNSISFLEEDSSSTESILTVFFIATPKYIFALIFCRFC